MKYFKEIACLDPFSCGVAASVLMIQQENIKECTFFTTLGYYVNKETLQSIYFLIFHSYITG